MSVYLNCTYIQYTTVTLVHVFAYSCKYGYTQVNDYEFCNTYSMYGYLAYYIDCDHNSVHLGYTSACVTFEGQIMFNGFYSNAKIEFSLT